MESLNLEDSFMKTPIVLDESTETQVELMRPNLKMLYNLFEQTNPTSAIEQFLSISLQREHPLIPLEMILPAQVMAVANAWKDSSLVQMRLGYEKLPSPEAQLKLHLEEYRRRYNILVSNINSKTLSRFADRVMDYIYSRLEIKFRDLNELIEKKGINSQDLKSYTIGSPSSGNNVFTDEIELLVTRYDEKTDSSHFAIVTVYSNPIILPDSAMVDTDPQGRDLYELSIAAQEIALMSMYRNLFFFIESTQYRVVNGIRLLS